ncbi:peptidoglycan-binding protein [Streptomyces sp. NPDC019793]|uniref:peptidoglycan-binding domain-containing protein n=1 Tax=unclassified Streptomyces TaxID=2593676 RepID=UPI0033E96FB2
MEQQKEPSQGGSAGAACPECGTPRAADNTPSCACGTRASDALRDARTAQAAAAEDFDPLRIRPYVDLDGAGEPPGAPAASGDHPAAPPSGPDPDGDTEATSALPTPLAPSDGSPSAHDLRLFEASATAPLPRADPGAAGADGGGRPPRRRKGVLLSAAGAVVVVLGAAGFASGLFSYDTPSRDGALPDEVRASVPDPSTSEAAPSAEPSGSSAAPSSSASPSASASASPSTAASASASPSPSASSASPTPSRSAEPTQSTTEPPVDASPEAEEGGDSGGGDPLRRGDQGSEVVELQQRLAEMEFYRGDFNGNYNRQVEDAVRHYQWYRGIYSDGVGVYGPDTRRRLESETREP